MLSKEKQNKTTKALVRKFPGLLLTRPETQKLFSREEIEAMLPDHTWDYIVFKKHLNGIDRCDGYDRCLLYRVNEEERKEIEGDIRRRFVHDTELAEFVPELQYYDGANMLEKSISKFPVPGIENARIAFALFNVTGKKEYISMIMDDYRGAARTSDACEIVVRLVRLSQKPLVFPFVTDIYVNDKDRTNRTQAILGILWHDGLLEDIDSIQEYTQKIGLARAIDWDSADKRAEFIREYDTSDKRVDYIRRHQDR